jgi:hypothetical protein
MAEPFMNYAGIADPVTNTTIHAREKLTAKRSPAFASNRAEPPASVSEPAYPERRVRIKMDI